MALAHAEFQRQGKRPRCRWPARCLGTLVDHFASPTEQTPFKPLMGEMGAQIVDTSALEQAELTQAKALVDEAAQRLRVARLNVTTAVEEGDPKSKIIDHAAQWHADLIVLGSHGRRGIDRFLLGSVSEAVSRHATCSVEIVRVPAQAGVIERAA